MRGRSAATIRFATATIMILLVIPLTSYNIAQANPSPRFGFTADETGKQVTFTDDHRIVKRLTLHVTGSYECIDGNDGISVKFVRSTLAGSLAIDTISGGLRFSLLQLSDIRMHMTDSQTIMVTSTTEEPGSRVIAHLHLSDPLDCQPGTYSGSDSPNTLRAIFDPTTYRARPPTIHSTLTLD